ncbi:MAG: PLP-dependent transferase [Thermoanaerobaculia bacterium]
MRLETIAVHAGGEPDEATGALTPPIHLSTTFEHGPANEPSPAGHTYQRESNPTQDRVEAALAALDRGAAALAFASGMAATSTMLQSLPEGARILLHRDVYTGVRELAHQLFPRWGFTAEFEDLGDPAALRTALARPTAAVWIETPSNPRLDVLDLAGVAAAARDAGALLIVDGTFATPALQSPLALGADVVMHSTTKYLGGHHDLLGGALVFARRDDLFRTALERRKLLGGNASPFSSWLLLRGLRSLACRVERHSANALAVARALDGHPALERVLYPGLPTHPGHAIAARQMRAFGGMVSLLVAGGRDAALAVAGRVQLFRNATSLGGPESTLEHRASAEGEESRTPPNLLRLSIGLEHPDDLVEDLLQALEGAR